MKVKFLLWKEVLLSCTASLILHGPPLIAELAHTGHGRLGPQPDLDLVVVGVDGLRTTLSALIIIFNLSVCCLN